MADVNDADLVDFDDPQVPIMDMETPGEGGGSPAPAEPVGDPNQPPAPAPEQTVVPPVALTPEQERYQYWQAKYDREVADVLPIKRLLDADPEVNAAFQDIIAKKAAGIPLRGAPPEPPKLEPPKKPVKPMNFSPSEISDPESESGKYMQELVSYQEQLADFFAKRDLTVQEELAQERNIRMAKEQENRNLALLRAQLNEKGVSGQEQDDFIKTMSSPQSLTLDNLIKIYKLNKGTIAAPTDESARKAEELLNRQQKQRIPLPAGVGGGEGQPQMTDEQFFNTDVLSKAKAKRR